MFSFNPISEMVSIIIPTYNRQNVIMRCLNSIFNQTYQNFEIIIIDDGSTDDTILILNSINEAKLRIIQLQKNLGAQEARNRGIKASKGEWIVFLDSDDTLVPNSLELRIEFLKQSPYKEALVYGDIQINDKIINFKKLNTYSYFYLLKELSLCPYSTILVTRSCFAISGLPNSKLPAWQDDDLVLTVGKYFPTLHCGKVVSNMYSSENSITKNRKSLYKGLEMIIANHKKDIVFYVGNFRLFLWKMRLLRSEISLIISILLKIENKTNMTHIAIYCLKKINKNFTRMLKLFFEHIYD